MPTKRRRIGRAPLAEWPAWLDIFFAEGTYPRGDFEAFLTADIFHEAPRAELRMMWEGARDAILRRWRWAHPGTRPYAWWVFDAPRMSEADEPWPLWRAQLCDPRRRLGGRGLATRDLPRDEAGAAFDAGAFGLPGAWEAETLDPADPPRFESEAAYLDRHGLLTASERRRLKPDAFEPVPIDPWVEGLDDDDPDQEADSGEYPDSGPPRRIAS
jgi:hypothetical protein